MDDNIVKTGEFYITYNRTMNISCNKMDYRHEEGVVYFWMDGKIILNLRADRFKLKLNFRNDDGVLFYDLTDR